MLRDGDIAYPAEGGAIRLQVENLACTLADLDETWPAAWKPEHGE